MNIPVLVLTLFRRPDRTRQLLAALDACYGVGDFKLWLSCDYAPEHNAACSEVWDIACAWLTDYREKHGGPVMIERQKTNLGIDLHKIHAISCALEWSGSDSVILGEDDTPFAPDALNYFCTMLDRTADEPDTLAICGYNRQASQAEFDAVKEQPYAVFRAGGFNPWGWAMHRHQWERFFGDAGERYRREVDVANGRFDWWLHGQGLQVVRPVLARTNHVAGEDATHTPSQEWLEANEMSRWTAADLNLPDNGLFTWDGA